MTDMGISGAEREVTDVITAYANAASGADSATLAKVFRDDARMWGYLGSELVSAPIEAFFEVVDCAPEPDGESSYGYTVTDVRVSGDVAVGTLLEEGFLGANFTNYFSLIREDNSWRIASKTFFLTGGAVPPR